MQNTIKFSVIIVAAGTGTRLGGDVPKQYRLIHRRTILRHTMDAFLSIEGLQGICIVIDPTHKHLFHNVTEGLKNIVSCEGGEERKDSVHNGLKALSHLKEEDIILIHDAARPFVKPSEIHSLLQAMKTNKAASLAHRVTNTLRYGNKENIAAESVSRENLWAMQTPQAFHYGLLKSAHEQYYEQHYTDDTNLVSRTGKSIKLIECSKENFKITTAGDLELAKKILSQNAQQEIRTGQGFDVHAFEKEENGEKCIRLCGIDITHDRALTGHSDADVGLHALTDAILGAIGEGDIGLHFPPANMDFKGMDSAIFLEHAMTLLNNKNGTLINADITLICENPKIGAYREQIITRIAEILRVSERRINIKATTTERLGFTGRSEGIAAQAIATVSLPVAKDAA